RIHSEAANPISRFLIAVYYPVVRAVLRFKKTTIALAVLMLLVTIPAFTRLGSEFMPPLNEGMIFYMPTTLPGISVTQAGRLLQLQDRILKTFPEVDRVFGKSGRAETPTDPAPFSMMETTVMLKPETEWRKGMTWDKLVEDMDRALRIPGVANAWTMPIKNRIDMLSTGIRTPVGIKIYGSDVAEIERIGERVEEIVKTVPGTRSVFAERVAGGYFFDFELNRDALARYGLAVEEAKAKVAQELKVPPGYTLAWSGQWENMLRVRERLKLVLPITFLVIWFLLYANTKSAGKALLVMLAVPFSAIGAVALLALLGYN